uniref:Transmembrane protein n=1 Tax=Dictyostelium discoideum TaxID=44689 RepID=Q9GPR4_DICDI|nr:unknown [Dictyostelium discoideum]
MTSKHRNTNKNKKSNQNLSNNSSHNDELCSGGSSSSINNSNSSLDDVKNKGEIFQSINNIFNEFNKQEKERNDIARIPHKIWDNYWVKKSIRTIEIIFWISLGLGLLIILIWLILYFNIGIVGLVGFISIYIYCGYFSKVDVKKNDDDWEKVHPKLIPFATIFLHNDRVLASLGIFNTTFFIYLFRIYILYNLEKRV